MSNPNSIPPYKNEVEPFASFDYPNEFRSKINGKEIYGEFYTLFYKHVQVVCLRQKDKPNEIAEGNRYEFEFGNISGSVICFKVEHDMFDQVPVEVFHFFWESDNKYSQLSDSK